MSEQLKTFDFSAKALDFIKTFDFGKTFDFAKTFDFLNDKGAAVAKELEALEAELIQSGRKDLAIRTARARQHLTTMEFEFLKLAVHGRSAIAAGEGNGASGGCNVHVHVHVNE